MSNDCGPFLHSGRIEILLKQRNHGIDGQAVAAQEAVVVGDRVDTGLDVITKIISIARYVAQLECTPTNSPSIVQYTVV